MRLRLTTVLVLLAVCGASAPVGAQAGPEAALAQVAQVVTGFDHTCALLTTGQVRCWGDNFNGQLGDAGSPTDAATPVTVLAVTGAAPLAGVTQLAAGDDHTCARLGTGQVRCWGDNDNGQLGDDSLVDRIRPVVVLNASGTAPLTGVRALSAGQDHTCALLTNGQARCWGDNDNGQLGDDTASDTSTPVTSLNAAGTALAGIAQVDAGGQHTCVLLGTGQVRCWGDNFQGQLGDGTNDDRDRARPVLGVTGNRLTGVTQLSAGDDHTCARLTTGRAVCWGDNVDSALGTGDLPDTNRPVAVRNGADTADLAGVISIEAGSNTTCARITGNQARCWGDNSEGQTGGGMVPSEAPLPVAVRNPIDTGPIRNVVAVAVGGEHDCYRLANTRVVCAGSNSNGQLGNDDLGNSTPVPVAVHL